jgi:Tol biopolymer transport system component
LNPRKLVTFPDYVGEVWVEPDAQRILLSQLQVVGDSRLLDIAADGTGLREVRKLSDDECNSCFIWTPDEKYLVYQFGSANHSDIWVLRMRTGLFCHPGKPVRLTNGPLPYSDPYPNRDGKQIFVLGTKERGELVHFDMKSHQFLPFLSGISATDPTFSRDGKWVAYASYPDHALWRSRSDGTERMQLTFPPIDVRLPFISPDGAKVAFRTDKGDVFVINRDGGLPQEDWRDW